MLTKRIIPCLDIKDGRTVKGINFFQLRDAGDPVELAAKYSNEGADELVFLDISATEEGRDTFADLVLRIAERIDIPFTVGGGIRSVDQVHRLLDHGADKISVNSAAVRDPDLISRLSNQFGSQCITVAVDIKLREDDWFVHIQGGKIPTQLDLIAWAKELEDRGAGEILCTSMDHDGTKNGFAIDSLSVLADVTGIPVIASGGGGNAAHFLEVFNKTDVDAALAASIFHFGKVSISELKKQLNREGVPVRY